MAQHNYNLTDQDNHTVAFECENCNALLRFTTQATIETIEAEQRFGTCNGANDDAKRAA